MGKIGACIAFLLSSTVAMAAVTGPAQQSASTDHLEPVKTATQAAASGDKSGAVELILYHDAFQPDVRARVLVQVFPCACEFMAFVVQTGTRFKLVDIYSDTPARFYARPPIPPKGSLPKPPPDPRKAHLLRTETPISSDLAAAIVTDWKKLLFQTRYEPSRLKGLDGIYFALSMEDKTGDFAGWSRNAGAGVEGDEPILAALQHAINAMALVCDGERDLKKCARPNVKELESNVGKLTKLLK